jgi:SWI/SNF-related matrix-associated actin-dependent regulator of chromatin subfamily E protein 1
MHTPRPPRPPDKPLLPYQRFSQKVWDTIKAEQPNLKPWDVIKTIGQMWKEMSDLDKQAYQESHDKEKAEYDEALRVYFSSQTYYAWQQNRAKGDSLLLAVIYCVYNVPV